MPLVTLRKLLYAVLMCSGLPATLAVSFTLTVCTGAQVATAQRRLSPAQQARTYYEEGRRAFSAGRFDEAVDRFRLAYSLSPTDAALYNVAFTLDRMERSAEALRAYEQYLAEFPNGEEREQVEGRIAELRPADPPPLIVPPRVIVDPPAIAVERPTRPLVTAADAPHVRERDTSSTVFDEPWFWIVTGTLLVGGGVAIGVAAHESSIPTLDRGNSGVVLMPLP